MNNSIEAISTNQPSSYQCSQNIRPSVDSTVESLFQCIVQFFTIEQQNDPQLMSYLKWISSSICSSNSDGDIFTRCMQTFKFFFGVNLRINAKDEFDSTEHFLINWVEEIPANSVVLCYDVREKVFGPYVVNYDDSSQQNGFAYPTSIQPTETRTIERLNPDSNDNVAEGLETNESVRRVDQTNENIEHALQHQSGDFIETDRLPYQEQKTKNPVFLSRSVIKPSLEYGGIPQNDMNVNNHTDDLTNSSHDRTQISISSSEILPSNVMTQITGTLYLLKKPCITMGPKICVAARYLRDLIERPKKTNSKETETRRKAVINRIQGNIGPRSRVTIQLPNRCPGDALLACSVLTTGRAYHRSKLLLPVGVHVDETRLSKSNDLSVLNFNRCDPNYYCDLENRILYVSLNSRKDQQIELDAYLITLYQDGNITKARIKEESLDKCILSFYIVRKTDEAYRQISECCYSDVITEIKKRRNQNS